MLTKHLSGIRAPVQEQNTLLFANSSSVYQAQVVRKVDNVKHRVNHYPAGSGVVCIVNTYLLVSDLSGR